MRTPRFEENGFRAIRFANEEVLFDIDNLIKTIKTNL
ncbi:MAG: DUF559 domain-containing protein [Bacteroidaceae bacterium]|nr:DUF559 domain-containing protein [Bacteroidaceae bacterium]